MTLPMAAWMRHRGHNWERVWEMVGAMVLPAAIALGLFWSGAIGAGPVCPIECTATLFTMLGVMLLRASEYGRPPAISGRAGLRMAD